MSYSIKQLREMTDAELIAEHDAVAVHTGVGTRYYVDELNRREQERAIQAADRSARASLLLTWATTVLAAVAVVIAVVALIVGR